MRDALRTALAPDAGSQAATATAGAAAPETFDRKAIEAAARKEATAEFARKYGWAQKVDQQTFERTTQFANRLHSDKVGFLHDLIAEMSSDPTNAEALRGILKPPTAATEDVEPSIYVRGADGQTYIDPEKLAAREAWQRRQILAEMQKEIGPLKQHAETLKQREAAVALDQKVTAWTGDIHGYIKSLPDYEANRAEIAAAFGEDVQKLLEQNPAASPDAIANVALRAYHRVTLPKAASSAEARVQATLKAKAEARNASPNGNGRSSVTAAPEMDEKARLRAELKKAGVGA